LVSPQYHCVYDDLFETTTGTQSRSIPKSQWQYKAGLAIDRQREENQEEVGEESDEENDCYSSNESEDIYQKDNMKDESEEEEQVGYIYIYHQVR
jgi:hypothetical protein